VQVCSSGVRAQQNVKGNQYHYQQGRSKTRSNHHQQARSKRRGAQLITVQVSCEDEVPVLT
jgi:hypothetical protein